MNYTPVSSSADNCVAGGCPVKLDLACVYYHFNDPAAPNLLGCVGLNNGASGEQLIERIAFLLSVNVCNPVIVPCYQTLDPTLPNNASIGQLMTSFQTVLCSFTRPVGNDTNFANTDLAFTANRTHSAAGFSLKINSLSTFEFNSTLHSIKGNAGSAGLVFSSSVGLGFDAINITMDKVPAYTGGGYKLLVLRSSGGHLLVQNIDVTGNLVIGVGPVKKNSNPNGMTINSSGILNLEAADELNGGAVTFDGTQHFGGTKIFEGAVQVNGEFFAFNGDVLAGVPAGGFTPRPYPVFINPIVTVTNPSTGGDPNYFQYAQYNLLSYGTGSSTTFIATGGVIRSQISFELNFNGRIGSAAMFEARKVSRVAGSSGTIDSLVGFVVEDLTSGTLANIGFEGFLSAGAGKWNVYMPGTASNHFKGNVLIGDTDDTNNQKLRVIGNSAFSGTIYAPGLPNYSTGLSKAVVSVAGNLQLADLSIFLPSNIAYTNVANVFIANQTINNNYASSTIAEGPLLSLGANVTQTGIGTFTIFKINVNDTSTSSGISNLIDVQRNNEPKFQITQYGTASFVGKMGGGSAGLAVINISPTINPTFVNPIYVVRAIPTVNNTTLSFPSITAFHARIDTGSGFTGGTITDMIMFNANSFTLGGGFVTNWYGFKTVNLITNSTINAYSFYSGMNISGSENRWNLYIIGTASNYMRGATLIGTSTVSTGEQVQITSNVTQLRVGFDASNYSTFNTSNSGILSITPSASQVNVPILNVAANSPLQKLQVIGDFTPATGPGQSSVAISFVPLYKIPSATIVDSVNVSSVLTIDGPSSTLMTTAVGFNSRVTVTAAFTGTIATVAYFRGDGLGTIPAGIVTNVHQFMTSTFAAGTNATLLTGFYGNIVSGAGKWNLYMVGTAPSYIAGILQIGSTTASGGAENLQVTGKSLFAGSMKATGLLDYGGTGSYKSVVMNLSTNLFELATITGGSGGSGVDTLTIIGAAPNTSGATITGTTLTLQPASGTVGGVVTAIAQSFVGDKRFTSKLMVGAVADTGDSFQVGTTSAFGGAITASGLATNVSGNYRLVVQENASKRLELVPLNSINVVSSLAPIGSVPNANGASITGSTLTLQPANATFGGVLTAGVQDIAGIKTFKGSVIFQGTPLTYAGTPTDTPVPVLIQPTIRVTAAGIGVPPYTQYGAAFKLIYDTGDATVNFGGVITSQLQMNTGFTGTIQNVALYETRNPTDTSASGSIERLIGFVADSFNIGTVLNIGFRGNVMSTATGAWNLYMDGTASNYLLGKLLLGSSTDTGQQLQVTGSSIFTAGVTMSGLPTYTPGPARMNVVSVSGILMVEAIVASVATLGPIGSTPNANAATIIGSTLNLQPASGSFGGVVTTLAQSFIGDKTFLSPVTLQFTNAEDASLYINTTFSAIPAGPSIWNFYNQMRPTFTNASKKVYGNLTEIFQTGSSGDIVGVQAFVNSTLSPSVTLFTGSVTVPVGSTIPLVVGNDTSIFNPGSSGSIGTYYGYIVRNTAVAVTSMYGFRGDITSASDRWNLYMFGNAANYIAGVLQLGSTVNTGEQLQVTGTSKFTDDASFGGSIIDSGGSAGTSGQILSSTVTGTQWKNNAGLVALSAVGSTPNANAATITGTTLNLQPANASFPGVITIASQVFAGDKRFNNKLITGTGPDTAEQFQVTGTARITGYSLFMNGSVDISGTMIRAALGLAGTINVPSGFSEMHVMDLTSIVSLVSDVVNIYSINSNPSIDSASVIKNVSLFRGICSRLTLATTYAGTIDTANAFTTDTAVLSGPGTLTNYRGFAAYDITQGTSTNIGFWSALSSGTGKWNIYAQGTAANYFAGKIQLGSTLSTGAEILQVTGNSNFSGTIKATGLPAVGAAPYTNVVHNTSTDQLELLPVAVVTRSVGINVDGQGFVATTGQKGYISIPVAGTIIGWVIIADQPGSCVFDVWKLNNTKPTVANTITGSNKPTLTSSDYISNSTMTSWTTAVAAGDVIGWNLDSVTAMTRVVLQLTIQLA